MKNFKKLQEKVQHFNLFVRENFEEADDIYSMQFGASTTREDIIQLETICNTKLPEDLTLFYNVFGSLTTVNEDECYSIKVTEVFTILKNLQMPDTYDQLASLGIIHAIKYSWGNDRYEFTSGEYFTQEQIDALNEKYKCFGLYRLGQGLEAAGYLYFDEQGNFGSLYYHQDYFEKTHKELLIMMDKSPTTHLLEEMLIIVIQEIKKIIIEEKIEDEM